LVNVLFVCLGNICRSPTAEGVFRALVERQGLARQVTADSAGTTAWNLGQPPDPRAQAEARRRGIDLSRLRARQAGPDDFHRFDYLLAMDHRNRAALAGFCPQGREPRLHLFLDFAPDADRREVIDPYSLGPEAFRQMFQLVETGARGLLRHIIRHDLGGEDLSA
jgi:protein-tyrosine phosphatase